MSIKEKNKGKKKVQRIRNDRREYDSLRSEIVKRVEIVNNQAAALGTIIAAWGASIALLVVPFNAEINNSAVLSGIYIMQPLSILAAIIFLYPMAIKSGENLRQVSIISCYIRIFFENDSLINRNAEGILLWEQLNNRLSYIWRGRIDSPKHKKISNMMKHFNDEYIILAIFSCLLYIIFSVLSIIQLNEIASCLLIYSVIGLEIAGLVWAIIYLSKIYIASSAAKNMINMPDEYLEDVLKIYNAQRDANIFLVDMNKD